MTRNNDAFDAHQRSRFMRPDAARWIRADAARWLKPLHPDEQKYSPSQPRDERGRWTDGGESGGSGNGSSSPMGQINFGDLPSFSDLFGLFQITPGDLTVDGVQLAGDEGGVRINPDELVNRHIMDEHVGKTDAELLARIEQSQIRGLFITRGMDRNGSFDSPESARDFIARTIESNSAEAEKVASGQQADAFLTTRFGYRTGREAYFDVDTSRMIMRPTYEVGVAIERDSSRTVGYRVRTAYPRNYSPRIGR